MEKNDQLFIQLLYIFHASGMQALGKIKNPITGKTEKNLDQVKQAIEMIEMLKDKTSGNLSQELIKMTDAYLTEMRLNYVDEMNKK